MRRLTLDAASRPPARVVAISVSQRLYASTWCSPACSGSTPTSEHDPAPGTPDRAARPGLASAGIGEVGRSAAMFTLGTELRHAGPPGRRDGPAPDSYWRSGPSVATLLAIRTLRGRGGW